MDRALPEQVKHARMRWDRRERAAFTVVEISVGAFILALVFLMGFTFMTAEQKSLVHLTQDLDVNATIEAAFSQLSRDVRAANKVIAPDLIEPADAPPKFEFAKNSVCVLEQATYDYRSVPVTLLTSTVTYFLEDPVELGELPGGGAGIMYSLYRQVGKPSPDKKPAPILTGIQELTFYRTRNTPGAPPPNGTGYYVLHIQMKVCNFKPIRKNVLFCGYAAEMDTMIKLRGSQ